MNNKKTPANFATTSALSAVNAIVAVTALTGIASSITSKAQASDNTQATYNAETQKSLGVNGLEMTTYSTVQTGSQMQGIPEDSKTTTDQY
jgi:hypothetical protein